MAHEIEAPDPPDFLTVPEAAAWLRIGRNQAYQAITRGEIPAIRLGRSVRVPRAALLRLIDTASGVVVHTSRAAPPAGRDVLPLAGPEVS